MFEIFTWFVMTLSLIAAVLIIKKHWTAFLLGSFNCMCWALVAIVKGVYPQAILFGVYFVMNMYGMRRWKRESDEEKKKKGGIEK